MQRNHIQKMFDEWRKANRKRFEFPLFIQERSRSGYCRVGFDGITPEITISFGKQSFGIWVGLRAWKGGGDGLDEFDIVERKDPVTGEYYCGLCLEPVRYKTRKELWVSHSFEPLAKWMDKNFQPDKWLCLYADPEDKCIWCAFIKDESDLQHEVDKRRDFYYAIPVIKPKGERIIFKK